MAYTTGTATDAVDFYAKLITYLKTNATLVAAGENWTEVWTGAGAYSTDKVLRGPGLSGADQIYVGFRLEVSTPGDSYRLNMVGMTGVIGTAAQYTEHVNVSPIVGVMLDVAAMNYWIAASGRRFTFAAKMSTVYESGHAGLFLPYGNPVNYPYPLIIGGTTRSANSAAYQVNTWRNTDESHRNFAHGNLIGTGCFPAAVLLNPIGEWKDIAGVPASNAAVNFAPVSFGQPDFEWAIVDVYSGETIGYGTVARNMSPCFDGSYAMVPFTLIQKSPAQTFGILDGVYFVAGQGNSSENLITAGGVDHLVVQNIFRTATGEYLAMKLA